MAFFICNVSVSTYPLLDFMELIGLRHTVEVYSTTYGCKRCQRIYRVYFSISNRGMIFEAHHSNFFMNVPHFEHCD